jgi:hypothetical protein
VSLWYMSPEQLDAYEAGEIERMPVGVFRCATADPSVVEDDEVCDYSGLWEAPLEEWWEPVCPECEQPAALVEIVRGGDEES